MTTVSTRWASAGVVLALLTACGGGAGSGAAGASDTGGGAAIASAQGAGISMHALAASTGLSGGWTIETGDLVNGARFIHPVNTDKDGAIVASRIASALGGLGIAATSDSREASIDPTRMADAAYVDDVASFVVNELYGTLAHAGPTSPLLGNDTVVLSSVHRYGLYVAETLHARYLPLQFMSFADDWSQVIAASTRATVIVGQDFDYGGLWLWNKLAAGLVGSTAAQLPPAYLQALGQATRVVVVQPNDNWAYCPHPKDCSSDDVVIQTYSGGASPIYLHSSLTQSTAKTTGTALYAKAKRARLVNTVSYSDVANLKQWEWGVPDSTIDSVRAAWAGLGKPAANLTVIRGGVVDMFGWTPKLWKRYLDKNAVAPRGFSFSSYWTANTQLERAAAIIPFPSYTYVSTDWHPLDDNARSVMTSVCGTTCTPALAQNTHAFVNTIGSSEDPVATQKVMNEFGLSAANGAWFGLGFNARGAGPWTGWQGQAVPTAWEITAADLQDANKSPYRTRPWTPLTVADVCGLGLYTCE